MYDVIVVGGGVAGLQSALILGRARRRVLVLDRGEPRNAPAAHAHGFLTRDGTAPADLLRLAREELEAYPSVQIEDPEAIGASIESEGFGVELAGGRRLSARKLVLATGVIDVLPEIPGTQELWSQGIHHCPFCHGWEVRDTTWAVLGDTPLAFERAALYRGWAREIVFLSNGPSSLDEEERGRLQALGAAIDERGIERFERHGDDEVKVYFNDGSSRVVGAVYAIPGQVHRSGLAEALGCELFEAPPVGYRFVKTDLVSGETTVPGVYAAGDIIGPMQSLILSAASGARAGYMLSHALAMEDALALTGATAGGH